MENNPMNEKETRIGFLKLGMSSEDIRQIFLMFEMGLSYFKRPKCQE